MHAAIEHKSIAAAHIASRAIIEIWFDDRTTCFSFQTTPRSLRPPHGRHSLTLTKDSMENNSLLLLERRNFTGRYKIFLARY
jgi:hypothetical protein